MSKSTKLRSITIQKAVTRSESIRTRLSHLAWSWGVGAFPLYDVPFAHSTGHLLANRMASFFSTIVEDNSSKKIHVYEFGVGLGMLAKHVMSHLKSEDPELYSRTQFHLSDYSREGLKQLESKDLFSDHKESVTYDVIDFNTPEFKKDSNPSIIYFSYLMDSLDQRHIEIVDGVMYELKVKTSISEDAILFDTTQFPPRLIRGYDIKSFIEDANSETLKIISPQLVNMFKESIVRKKLEWLHLNEEETKVLKSIEASAPMSGVCRFNIPIQGVGALRKLLESLSDEGVLLFQDFGFVEPYETYPRRLLTTQYKSIICHAQYFPLFEYLAKETGTQFEITRNKSGHTQILGFYKGKNGQRFKKNFKESFPDIGDEHTNKILKKLKRYEKKEGPKITTVEKWIADLRPFQEKCYFMLVSIARFYMDKGEYEPVLEFLERSLEYYEPVAVSTYLMYGKIFRAMGLHDEAVSVLKKSLSLAPNFSPSLSELSLCYLNQNKFENYLDVHESFTKYLGEVKVWNQWIMRVLVLLELKRTDKAIKIIEWLEDINKQTVGVVPEEILIKCREIKKSF